MKKLFFAIAVLAAPLCAAPIQLNRIVAIVNGKTITTREVRAHLTPRVNQLLTKYPRKGEQFQKALAEAQEGVIEQLIEDKLVLSKVKDMNGRIPDHVVKDEVGRIIRENFNGKESEFREYLRKINATRRDFEESQREKILIQIFKQQQFKDIAPATETEIKARYRERASELRDFSLDKISFRRIYIPARDEETLASVEDQLALAERLADEVQKGRDFSETAIAHSAGAFATEGGLWKDTPRSDLEIGFGDILFDTPDGQIVGPLKDRRGFTIVQVIKKSPGPNPPFDKNMRERMRAEVEIEKRADRYDEWIKLLKRSAMIKRKL